ncbi:MAG: hypothetical protein HN919_13915 [Verrucomicrobia bacterium]|nr:hypothetical protein [Verrucomicrobiota bacterium]MBT7067396.1 hypothetical protein [Verrucomicrobiota bacterium]MBT7702409.1 hypothetical protein [Verrucomicrobiota bacterium]
MTEEQVSLLDYLLPLLRWRWLIFGCCALCGMLGILSALSKTPYYTATAYFMPSGAMGEKSGLESIVGDSGKDWARVRSASDMVKYYAIAMKSRPLMQTMLDRPFSEAGNGTAPLQSVLFVDADDVTTAKAMKALREKLKIASGGGKMLKLEFSAAEATLAAAVVNALLEEFGRQPRDSERASDDVAFIQDRIADVQLKLETKERELAERQSRSLDLGQPDTIRQLAALEREARLLEKMYETLNAELARSEIRMIQSQGESGREIEILEPAEVPMQAVKPDRQQTIAVFAVIGFVLSAAAAFAIEYVSGMRRVFSDHPFWTLIRKARRDLIVMAIVVGLLLIAAVLYRSLG